MVSYSSRGIERQGSVARTMLFSMLGHKAPGDAEGPGPGNHSTDLSSGIELRGRGRLPRVMRTGGEVDTYRDQNCYNHHLKR